MAGLEKIPAYIRVADDEQMLEMALIENIHRKDLNAIEVAISYKRLQEELNLTQEKLSEKIGKNRSTITNFLRLLKLPPTIQVALRDELISMGHARALLPLENKKTQKKILKEIIDKGLSVRQVESMVREILHPQPKPEKEPVIDIPDEYRRVSDELSKLLGTKVNFRRNNKGKGNLVINFKNDDDLERILKILNK